MMNKKQWIALGFMFMMFAFLVSYFATGYSSAAISYTGEYLIAANIQDAMYTFLTWLCFIAAVACWVCGWLEKERV